MGNVRSFDGVDDQIVLDTGILGAINNGGAFSAMTLAYPTTLVGTNAMHSVANGATGLYGMYHQTSTHLRWGSDAPSVDTSVESNLSANQWQVLGISKAAGSAQPRAHRKQLGAGSWTHADMPVSVGTNATVATRITVGVFPDNSGPSAMQLGVVSMWTSNLSDGDFVNIESNASTDWILTNLPPAMLTEYNQASTGTNVTDLTGNGADQTAITGTSIVTTNDPAWTFHVSGVQNAIAWIVA